MRIACVFIPHFRTCVERLRDPRLAGRPVVIGQTPDGRSSVLLVDSLGMRRHDRPA